MDRIFFQALSPVVCLVINVLSQLMVFRFFYKDKDKIFQSVFLGFFFGSVGFWVIKIFGHAFDIFVCEDLLTYCLLGYGYFHFINLTQTARRIRILTEIKESSHGLTYEEVLKRYNAREVLERRIARLKDHGQVVCRQGRYVLADRFLLAGAMVMSCFKRWALKEGIGDSCLN
jgi:hypothetical protein